MRRSCSAEAALAASAGVERDAAPDLASPAPRRRGSNPPSVTDKGAARELFSFEDDQAEAPAPAPAADDEGPIADDRTADGVFAESEGEEEVVEEAPSEELRVGGGAVDKETGQTMHVVGKTKGWWTVQAPGAAKPLSRRASSLTPCAPPPEDANEDDADANAATQLGGDAPADDAETQVAAIVALPANQHALSAGDDRTLQLCNVPDGAPSAAARATHAGARASFCEKLWRRHRARACSSTRSRTARRDLSSWISISCKEAVGSSLSSSSLTIVSLSCSSLGEMTSNDGRSFDVDLKLPLQPPSVLPPSTLLACRAELRG